MVIGGYGVFGERLARLLVRDGHAVTIAGRNLSTAEALATELNCAALRFDRDGDLACLSGHDVVVDAAGPFHAYGRDPYRLARAALAARMHYLDLADDAGFCAGITALDAEARAAGRCAISGLSSVPALSSAAVRALSGDEGPRVIDTAILPGNRSAKGLSVITSILSQAGRPMAVWRGRAWSRATGWSAPAHYWLPGGLVRQGWQIEVPDLALFPAHFGAESVIFRAGPELWIMRYGLAAFASARRIVRFPVTPRLVKTIQYAAELLEPFGTGRGGMSVEVVVGKERRSWRLLAEEGDGPFIPVVAARALLRRPMPPPGARPALEAVTLQDAEAAMSDLNVRCETDSAPFEPIFPKVLGPSFDALPDEVKRTHQTADVSRWSGTASVRRGTGIWAGLLARLFGFPAESDGVRVVVIKSITPAGETWERRFGTSRFRSHLAATRDGMTDLVRSRSASVSPSQMERCTFRFALAVSDGSRCRAGHCRPRSRGNMPVRASSGSTWRCCTYQRGGFTS